MAALTSKFLSSETCGDPWGAMIAASSGEIRRLASVWRYSSIPITVPENVADHSFWVILYSAMIHLELQCQSTKSQGRKYGKQDVLLNILLKATTHDVGEAMTGDIVRPFKYSSSVLKEAIDRAERSMMNALPASVNIFRHMCQSDDDEINTYVNAVVKAADFMSLYQFMRREVLRGNCEIRDFVGRMVKDLDEMSKCAVPSGMKYVPYPLEKLGAYYRRLATAATKLHMMTRETRGEVI